MPLLLSLAYIDRARTGHIVVMKQDKAEGRELKFKLNHRSTLICHEVSVENSDMPTVQLVAKCHKTFNRLTAADSSLGPKQTLIRLCKSPQVVIAIVIWLCVMGLIALAARAGEHDYMLFTLSLCLTGILFPWKRLLSSVGKHARKNKVPYGLYVTGLAGCFCAVILLWLPLRMIPESVSKDTLAFAAVGVLFLRLIWNHVQYERKLDDRRLNFKLVRKP